LVRDSLSRYNWTLENSTKKIGDYVCYKAISVVKVAEKTLQSEDQRLKIV
jgi:GLPGLI family protein